MRPVDPTEPLRLVWLVERAGGRKAKVRREVFAGWTGEDARHRAEAELPEWRAYAVQLVLGDTEATA